MDAPKRIMVVEDEPLVRELLRTMLAEAGYAVSEAADGVEALARVGAERPDLVVMDIRMPRLDGLQVLRRLKSARATSAIPVVMLTANASAENVVAAVQAGASDFCVKQDIGTEQILAKIRRALGGAPAGRSSAPPRIAPVPPLPAEPVRVETRPSLSPAEVAKRLARAADLKTMPFVAAEVIELTGSRGTDAQQLADTIRRDPALSARVMKVVNSAFYAGRGRVQSLNQAVTAIGFRGIRDLALAVSIVERYRSTEGGISRLALWEHSIACAALARNLSQAAGDPPEQADQAFMAGLLHDLGAAVLDDLFGKEYREVLTGAAAAGLPLPGAERGLLGTDHAAAARIFLARCGFPDGLTDAITCHHAPWGEIRKTGDPGLTAYLKMADLLVRALGFGSDGDGTIEPVPGDAIAFTCLTGEKIAGAIAGLARQVDELRQILFLHDEDGEASAGTVSGEEIPMAKRPLALIFRERLAAVDPVELLVARRGLRIRQGFDLEKEWRDYRPAVVVACAESEAWCKVLSSQAADLWGKPGSARPRFLALAELPVGTETAARLAAAGAVVLTSPYPLAEIERAIAATAP